MVGKHVSSGALQVCSRCPKCQTLPPRTTLRGVVLLVTCPLCEREYAYRAPTPVLRPPAIAKPARRSMVTAFAEWLGGVL